MSPLNRALNHRTPTVGARPLPPPRFSGRLVSPGMPRMPPPPPPRMARMPPRMPPRMPSRMPSRMPPLPPLPPLPPIVRQRLSLLRPAGGSRPNGLLPNFPRPRHTRGIAPSVIPPMVPRDTRMLRGPPPRHWLKKPPSQIMPPPPPPPSPPVRARFSIGNENVKGKPMGSAKKLSSSKLEELELKKPWLTDEIRSEVQKKNRLYAKAKKNKDTVEWKEFKGVRNKVTRMLRDARNEYFAKHPEQAHLYPDDEEVYDERDENYVSSDDDTTYCEICDREFPSEDALIEHKSTHIICNIDGCTFSAFPLLVEKHIRMQHSTGLFQRMKNLSTPEDIEKWIIERKKKYPTKTNIELHKAKELEKSQRGEIIKQNYCMQRKTTGRASNMRERKRKCRKQHTRKLDGNSSDSHIIYRGLRPFPGTSILEEDMNEIQLNEQTKQTDAHEEIADNISDEDDVSQPFVEAKPISLPTLVADYGSEEDEDEGPEEVPLKKMREENTINYKIAENAKTVCEEITNNIQSYANTNNKSINQTKIDKMSQRTVAKYKDNHNNEINRVAINKRNEQTSHRHQNKLLQLLLSRSIQHERNLICQCLKYVIDHNFFNQIK